MTGVIAARAKQTGVSYEAMEKTYLDKVSMRRMVTASDVAATIAYLLSPPGGMYPANRSAWTPMSRHCDGYG